MLTNMSGSYAVTNLDKIIELNGCKYYLSPSILYFLFGRQPVLLLNYQQLNYDSPPIANKFSFIILQNKHKFSPFDM